MQPGVETLAVLLLTPAVPQTSTCPSPRQSAAFPVPKAVVSVPGSDLRLLTLTTPVLAPDVEFYVPQKVGTLVAGLSSVTVSAVLASTAADSEVRAMSA